MFDLRVKGSARRRGIGRQAVVWLTRYVFVAFPAKNRIEATTHQDNWAMRRLLRRCGYVKEAHYRESWVAPDGAFGDTAGYAILRRDWAGAKTTLPDWADQDQG